MGKSQKQPNCCICIPLETGVKIIAALALINTIGSVVDIYYYEDSNTLKMFLPFALIWGLQFCFFMVTLMQDSVMNRHILCASYLLLVIVATRSLLFHFIYEGEMFDPKMCGDGADLEDCKKQSQIWLWAWYCLDTMWVFYLFHQLGVYAKRPLRNWHDGFTEGVEDNFEKPGQPLV